MTVTKATLRKSMQEKLAKVSEAEREEISEKIQKRLFESKLWQQADTIGIYLSFGNEWDTRTIIEKAWQSGKNVAVPKTNPAVKELNFYQINDFSEVRKGHFNLEEPIVEKTKLVEKDAIDLLIVPGLVFSKDGYRIGFGGGYYDRFLTDFIHPTVSLVWSGQLVEYLPTDWYDIPVQYLCTEK